MVLDCIDQLRTTTPDILILIGQMPWGGSNGVLDFACEAGYLDRVTPLYFGEWDGLIGVSDRILNILVSASNSMHALESLIESTIEDQSDTLSEIELSV